MNPSQTEPTTASRVRERARPEPAADRSNGEHRSFSPGQAWREDQADEQGRSYLEGGQEAGGQETSEAATNLRGALQAVAAMQLAGGRLLDDWMWRMVSWNALPTLWPAHPLRSFGLTPPPGLPPVDVKETNTGYSLCLELPGLTADDVDIRVRGDVITISGQKSEGKETTEPTYHVSERRYGRFERSFPIPPDVERSGMTAKVSEGVLSIALPKAAAVA
jgi:HSP20 family molecular chaperone IbpA